MTMNAGVSGFEVSAPGAPGATTTTVGVERVMRLVAGDGAAWAELRRKEERELRKRLKRFLARQAVLPSDAADDIVQSLYVRLLRDDRQLLRRWIEEPRVPFGAFMWTIARGIAKDEAKAARSRGMRSIHEDERASGYGLEDDDSDRDGAEAWYERGRGAAFVAAERAERSDDAGVGLTFDGEAIEHTVLSRHRAVLASCSWIPMGGVQRRAFFQALHGAVLVAEAWDRPALLAWFGGRNVFLLDRKGQRIGSYPIVTRNGEEPTMRAARAALKALRFVTAGRPSSSVAA
jgi:DNA-directed RNA polymerase specialized sigma24 family protein